MRFNRIAIVNRGEPAMRLIHAVREMDAATHVIALYTEPDRRALFVREADEAWCLGPAQVPDPSTGALRSAYVDLDRLEQALVQTRAQAAWPGWGFVAEDARFAGLCERLGITFLGPSAQVIRDLGDKIAAKHLCEANGVPVAPWSGGPLDTLEQAREVAQRLGFPLMLKASAGGGGRGIRKITSLDDLDEAFPRARAESAAAFGDDRVFLERMMVGARHIEVQVIADTHGTAWALGVRDCSVQRRNQKLIEESGSAGLSDEQIARVSSAARRLVQAAGYTSAGTVEFLFEPATGAFSFMEVNARLQVEHPVTEATTGADLVKLQLLVGSGGHLDPTPPPARGCAIEARLNAEDPAHGFAPAPGQLRRLRLPSGPGIRVDTGISEGDPIPPDFDSMIAKVIAWGRDRAEAIGRLRHALANTVVVIEGGTTNKAFMLAMLDHPELRAGDVDIGWLERVSDELVQAASPHGPVALISAAIEVFDAAESRDLAHFQSLAVRGRPSVSREPGRWVELSYGGVRYKPWVGLLGPSRYRVALHGPHGHDTEIDVDVDRFGVFERRISIGGQTWPVIVVPHGVDYRVEVNHVPHRISREDGGTVRSPAPAVVLSMLVKPGDTVEAGARVAVLEAMKMEMAVTTPVGGVVREVHATPGVQVEAGSRLLVVEAPKDDVGVSVQPLDFRPLGRSDDTTLSSTQRAQAILAQLHALVLGYDIDSDAVTHLLEERQQLEAQLAPDDPDVWRSEERILRAFSDVWALFRRRQGDREAEATQPRSTEEYLFKFMRALDPRQVPAPFVRKLETAISHYGVDDIDVLADRLHVMMMLFRARQNLEAQTRVVGAILERWLRLVAAGHPAPRAGRDLRELVDRVEACARRRHGGVRDLARSVRYWMFDLPEFEQLKLATYTEIEQARAALLADPTGPLRDRHMSALAYCTLPIASRLSPWLGKVDPNEAGLYLEALLRRFYQARHLERVHIELLDQLPVATAAYDHDHTRVQAFVCAASVRHLRAALEPLATRIAQVDPTHDVAVDLYLRDTAEDAALDAVAAKVAQAFDLSPFDRPLRRVVVILARPPDKARGGHSRYITLRHTDNHYQEERIWRGLHPMLAKRLRLWLLANFALERLPTSAEDIYLFRCVAHENPDDVRLFAFAEVRDSTPRRNQDGYVVGFPTMERMLAHALDDIRREQSRRSDRDRLLWNRVYLQFWEPVDIRPEELGAIVRRSAPETQGLGIEKVVAHVRFPDGEGGTIDTVAEISNPDGGGAAVRFRSPDSRLLAPITRYEQNAVRALKRGLLYPYEIIKLLTQPRKPRSTASSSQIHSFVYGNLPPGSFQEYDLDPSDHLVPVDRPPGGNTANLVVGVITSHPDHCPQGMVRVILLSDPIRQMGALAEPECRRVIEALDLAQRLRVPVEWFSVSAGARIAMDSGTENLDWTARVLRRIVEFTQAGGEINVIVSGINVGAQSYWNAEATMLMHTRGILVMTAAGSLVLTGKEALAFSGSVSADSNLGIGGYDHIMGPNGQAQYWARDVGEAARILFHHYAHTYVLPTERFPRQVPTADPLDRDICESPHAPVDGVPFSTIGEIFDDRTNPGRKKPFAIREVMAALVDADHPTLERWPDQADADTAVVWDAHLGGWPVCLVGIESRPNLRLGLLPADGPDRWSAGTLFPQSSRKVARALNATSGNRPMVILANLSGFDGSPESMRELQLEYGAEIGRAVVNFDGPIIFCVISRYHGGAYVVFSNQLNPDIEVAALRGTYASVIGGAPAAAVVFARDVRRRSERDPRVAVLVRQLTSAPPASRAALREELTIARAQARSENIAAIAEEFDAVHTVQRAQRVGSVDRIIAPGELRPYVIDAIERGIQRVLDRERASLKR